MFYAGSLGYFAQYTALTHVAGLQQGAHQSLLPSIGTYGYVPKVNYLFGLPRAIEPGGIEMDLDNISTFTGTNQNDRTQLINFVQQTGTLSSALEHAVPEQMFTDAQNPGEAISAVKALSMASDQGQRVYYLNKDNYDSTIQNINLDAGTINEIKNVIDTGKIVITHTDPVSITGWSGAGYIILDPATGEGAYKISNGLNGAIFAGAVTGYVFTLATLLFVITDSFNAQYAPQILGAILAMLLFVYLMLVFAERIFGDQYGCFLKGFLIGSAVADIMIKWIQYRGIPVIKPHSRALLQQFTIVKYSVGVAVKVTEPCVD